jgi:class 3 adenylate cyclase
MWGAAMDVGGWLRNLGLDKYQAAFRENGIDEQVIRHVTAEDLREIGVATVGDRRKLLAAIAELAAPSPSTEPRPPPSPAVRPKTPEVPAERRPITVMFCDLVGSTALASRLDAEDWRSLVNAYLDEASDAVNRLGGHVLKRLGDGLMALFGYPHAQENDAERAVRAALAIQRALFQINAKNAAKGAPQLSARIGLESGPVVVEATGEVFGEAPNVAARVQGLAEPGTVLVTANVQRQVAGLFVADDRGTCELKGVPVPMTLYRIVRASGGRRTGARALTPLVGREEELGHLRRRWERARNGAGQLTLIVGEPGIGKSRLVEEFRATLGETPTPLSNCRRRSSCRIRRCIRSPNGADSALARRSLPTGASPTSKTLCGSSAWTPPNVRPCWHRWLTSRCRKTAPRSLRRRNCAAGNCRRSSRGFSPGRARSRSPSHSRTCTGPTRRRST